MSVERIGYLGPAGTFSEEAAIAALGSQKYELVPITSIYDTVLAVQAGLVDRALVPIENSLEGSVNATLDALTTEAADVQIVGEVVEKIEHCLIARNDLNLDQIETVISHPQPTAQCGHFLREELPNAMIRTTSSTALAVQLVAESKEPWAALGTQRAAEIYGCTVIRSGVEDRGDNETRFVWLSRQPDPAATSEHWKTSLVFWEKEGADEPGWLVRCLAEFASREINLTRIESRPRKQGLGQYMFFTDLEGRESDPEISEAIDALRERSENVRVLGSYPAVHPLD